MTTVSLELSKELKKAGYPQEGEFWWRDNGEILLEYKPEEIYRNMYSAPTVDELLEMLPRCIIQYDGKGRSFWVDYEVHTEKADTLPDALAKMLLYLQKKGIVRWGK